MLLEATNYTDRNRNVQKTSRDTTEIVRHNKVKRIVDDATVPAQKEALNYAITQ